MLINKHILLGVTGGIAAYKIPLLVRLLKKAKADVRVVMTKSAGQFVTAETLAALSGNDVVVDIFPPEDTVIASETWHIRLGEWADVMLIAPATANTLAKLAYGMGDNAVTMLALALRCPLVLSPAMDVDMWHHPATRKNIFQLSQFGYHIIQPEIGALASGLVGEGRMPEAETLLSRLDSILDRSYEDFSGKHFLITAGPTYEAIDPVRFIGNRSSGKMGFALAQAAAQRGANVTLISGPVYLATPNNVLRIDVESAEQMANAVNTHRKGKHIIIMAAAVADYTPEETATQKLKKEETSEKINLVLKKTQDILSSLGKSKGTSLLIGFALETHNDVANATSKLERKNLDMIVLNNALQEGAGFGTDTNIIGILTRNKPIEQLPLLSKQEAAHAILDRIKTIRPR